MCWNGKYSETRESKESLEKDIERAMTGWIRSEVAGGGTLDERTYLDGGYRVDLYLPSSSSKGHSHDRLTSTDGYKRLHD